MTPARMAAWTTRQWAALVVGLVFVIVVLAMAWPRQQSMPMPRIIDEHGNNLVYQCPGDPRCEPSPTLVKH